MSILGKFLDIWLLMFVVGSLNAEWRSSPRRVTAEYGSDLSLSCTFQSGDNDETIIQWLYQNITDGSSRRQKHHWKPLFLNAQSLTPKETRYSIQQKIQQINRTSMAYSTILTLTKVTDADEGIYVCKSLSPKPTQMTYQIRVIQSLDTSPKQLVIPANEIGQYSIRLNCVLYDNHTNRRHHDIFWWHNNKRLGSQTNRYARIIKNYTQHSLTSSLFYTGEPANIVGKYICESEPLKRYISVALQINQSSGLYVNTILLWIIAILRWSFQYQKIH